MALIPKICVGVKNNCSTFVIKDITEEYNVDTNAGGWGSPNIDISDVEGAYINITYSTGITAQYVVDILTLPTTVTGKFTIAEIDIAPLDGEYTVEYQIIIDDRVAYSAKVKIFSTCLVRCCIDKMWAKYASGVSEDCNCSESKENTALTAEALYRALLSSSACLDSVSRDVILKKIQRLCELEDCKCK